MKRLLTFLGLSIFLFSSCPAFSEEGRFEKFSFNVKGRIDDVITDDLDGDGLKDLTVIHIDRNSDPPARYVTIYLQDKEKGFPSSGIRWDVPDQVSAIDAGDVSADEGKELVFITEKGVSYSHVEGGKITSLQEMFEVQSVVAITFEGGLPYYNFVKDYTGDGKDDVLVVGFYEAVLAKQGADYSFSSHNFRLRPGINIEAWDNDIIAAESEHPMLRVSYFVPRVYSLDANSDGLVDLIANYNNEIYVYYQEPDGFTYNPAKHYRVRLFKDSSKDRSRGRNQPQIDFHDFDNDGKFDVVAHKVMGDIGNLESRTVLFYGKSGGLEHNKPDLEFKPGKMVLTYHVADMNKDGREDLILPTMDLNLLTVAKVFVTSEINFEYTFYLAREDGTFNSKPDRTAKANIKFAITKFKFEHGFPNIFGDYNGDGYPDLVAGEEPNKLVITLKDGEGQPLGMKEAIDVPVALITRPVDMNQDGYTDLVFFYQETLDYPGVLHVFMNKGNWTAE